MREGGQASTELRSGDLGSNDAGVVQPSTTGPHNGEHEVIAGASKPVQISKNAIARCFNAADAGFGCPTGL